MTLNADDPRLTAYALGELDDDDRAAIESAIQSDASLQEEIKEVLAAVEALQVELAAEPCASLSDEERNEFWRVASESREPGLYWPRLIRIGAVLAAACIVVGIFLPMLPQVRTARRVSPLSMMSGDLNNDGAVDIVDAFLLARTIANEQINDQTAMADFDFTSDGVVDQADVDYLAHLAVRLGEQSS